MAVEHLLIRSNRTLGVMKSKNNPDNTIFFIPFLYIANH